MIELRERISIIDYNFIPAIEKYFGVYHYQIIYLPS